MGPPRQLSIHCLINNHRDKCQNLCHEGLDLQSLALTLFSILSPPDHAGHPRDYFHSSSRRSSKAGVARECLRSGHTQSRTHTKICLRSAHQNTLAIHGAFTCHTQSRTQTRHWLAREATPRASHLKLSTPSSESHNISPVRHQRPQAPQASSPPQGHPQ